MQHNTFRFPSRHAWKLFIQVQFLSPVWWHTVSLSYINIKKACCPFYDARPKAQSKYCKARVSLSVWCLHHLSKLPCLCLLPNLAPNFLPVSPEARCSFALYSKFMRGRKGTHTGRDDETHSKFIASFISHKKAFTRIIRRLTKIRQYRDRLKYWYVVWWNLFLLAKQGQEQISPNHVPILLPISVHNCEDNP